jgi:predicted TIM-barrel fold metal-dependent hydrolase
VNRWLKEAWLDRDPRLLGCATVAPQHAAAAAAEIDRIAAEERFVAVALPSRSPQGYGCERYRPVIDAVAGNDLVLTLTVAGSAGAPPSPVNWMASFFEDHAIATTAFQSQLLSLVFSGTFSRHPGLEVVLAGSGWTWMPHLLWRMDQEWKSFRREVPWLEEPPSSYARRHVRMTTQPVDAPPDPMQLLEVHEQLQAEGMLIYGSEFPHPDDGSGAALAAALPAQQRRALLRENARACYRLDRFDRLAGALPAGR